MAGSGGTSRAEQDRLRALAELADAIREDRAAGRKRWRGGAAAWGWYEKTLEAWCAPKGLPFEADSGAPSRGAENPARRRSAAVAVAIKAAEARDHADHPTKPAPISAWGRQHFGTRGRSFMWIAENTNDWTQAEVERRMRRALRILTEHLRERGWIE